MITSFSFWKLETSKSKIPSSCKRAYERMGNGTHGENINVDNYKLIISQAESGSSFCMSCLSLPSIVVPMLNSYRQAHGHRAGQEYINLWRRPRLCLWAMQAPRLPCLEELLSLYYYFTERQNKMVVYEDVGGRSERLWRWWRWGYLWIMKTRKKFTWFWEVVLIGSGGPWLQRGQDDRSCGKWNWMRGILHGVSGF